MNVEHNSTICDVLSPPTADRTAEPRNFLRAKVSSADRLLVAVSGGADSLGLLALLVDEFGYERERIVVAHVNHQLRATAARDLEFVSDLARERGLEFVSRNVDVQSLARRHHLSMEAAARKLRYEALQEMAAKSSCRWILTGHTLDDSAETVLMRMLSSASWYECSGIPNKRGNILRPLLTVPRSVLRGWAESRGVNFCEDETNADLHLRRNWLRHKLSTNYNYWTNERIRQVADAGADLNRLLAFARRISEIMFYKPQLREAGQYVSLANDDILSYFSRLSFLPVEACWARLTGDRSRRLPSSLRKQIVEFLRGKLSNGELKLPDDVVLVRRPDRVWICRDYPQAVHQSVSVGSNVIVGRNAVLKLGRSDFESPPSCAIKLDGAVLDRNLCVRSPRPGDRIKPPGRPTKKISDWMNEQHFDPIRRAALLLLADESGPLALLGGPVAERALPEMNDPNPAWLTVDTVNECDERCST